MGYEALYISEGSDWFWWFGEDQEFDDLFRLHLKNVYRAVGVKPPAELSWNIVPHAVIWTFTRPVKRAPPGDRLTVCTNCQSVLTWQVGVGPPQEADLIPAGGAMAAVQRYQLTLGPFSYADPEVRFRCTYRNCDGREICCNGEEHVVQIEQPAPRRE